MKIFLTGGTGFIGSHLALQLAKQGHIIHALVRSLKKGKLLEHENIHLFKGDIVDRESIDRAIAGCDQVYHIAAYMVAWDPDEGKSFRINVGGTVNVLEAAVAAGVKEMVFTSSAGTLGPSNGTPITEESIRITDFFHDYESSKFMAEERCVQMALSGRMKVVIVNPTRVYGPEIYPGSSILTDMIEKLIRGKWRVIPGDGQKIGNYAYVDDVVRGHILAMEKGKNGQRYLLGGENLSWEVFLETTKEAAGVDYRLQKLPVWVMNRVARASMMQYKVTGTLPRVSEGVVRKYVYDWESSSEKAIRELGYSCTPFSEGLKATIEYLEKVQK